MIFSQHLSCWKSCPSRELRLHRSDEQQRLFEIAQTWPSWLYAYVATTLSFYCGLRACEIKALRWHGRNKRLDPTRGMTSWRTAWRNIRKAAGLGHVRFHDGRHTAITTLAEKGLPDWEIQAQVGHVAPEMMKTYSHIRREALNQAAAALEPAKPTAPEPHTLRTRRRQSPRGKNGLWWSRGSYSMWNRRVGSCLAFT